MEMEIFRMKNDLNEKEIDIQRFINESQILLNKNEEDKSKYL